MFERSPSRGFYFWRRSATIDAMQGPGVPLTFKLLDESCELGDFSCGEESWARDLDDFIHYDALRQQEVCLGSTHVFYLDDEVVAFVCLAATGINIKKTPSLRERIGLGEVSYTHVPAVLIGRLAVDGRFQRKGIGAQILSWVRNEVYDWRIGARFLALHVDRENSHAIRFYQSNGFFIPLEEQMHPNRKRRLMLLDLSPS